MTPIVDLFGKALERISEHGISKKDIENFEDYFPFVSGKNHLFNMLVLPIRKSLQEGAKNGDMLANSYEIVAKGLVLLTKALKQVNCDDIRAVNENGKMELNASRRERMAQYLLEVITKASDVKQKKDSGSFGFIDKNKQFISDSVEMEKGEDEETKRDVFLVKISLPS